MLSAGAVADAAVAVAARDGLAAVGMRAVAKDLGVTPMALYRYVGAAADLQTVVIDQLLAGLPEVGGEGTWDQRCIAWAHTARRVFGEAPGLARHVLLGWIHLPRVLAAVDSLVATLDRDGPPGCDAVAGANAILMHVLMRAQAEESVRVDGVQRDLSTLRSHRARLPHLWAHRDEYRRARLDEHFTYGLDALLAGIASARRER